MSTKKERAEELRLPCFSWLWLLGCLLLTAGYGCWLLFAAAPDTVYAPNVASSKARSIAAACLYMLSLLGLTLSWMSSVRRASDRRLREAREIAESIMRGEPRRTGYTESELSLLEHRLVRFAELCNEHAADAAREKEVIQRLIADISHQIKTPLANMLLYAELLEERLLADEGARAWTKQVKTQADKLHFLIRSLVDMSRLETGILTMHPACYPLRDAAVSAVDQAAAAAKAAGISLIVKPSAGRNGLPLTALYDPKWTAEALFNLLDNAIKYGRSGGTVTISFAEGDVYGCIEVSDDGPGIEEEERAQIFGRFRRGRNAGTTEGVGLGLYLAREIVQRQGGRIQVGASPEGGASFRIFLPIASSFCRSRPHRNPAATSK